MKHGSSDKIGFEVIKTEKYVLLKRKQDLFSIFGFVWHFGGFDSALKLQAVYIHISAASDTYDSAHASDTKDTKIAAAAGMRLLERYEHIGKELDDLHTVQALLFC